MNKELKLLINNARKRWTVYFEFAQAESNEAVFMKYFRNDSIPFHANVNVRVTDGHLIIESVQVLDRLCPGDDFLKDIVNDFVENVVTSPKGEYFLPWSSWLHDQSFMN